MESLGDAEHEARSRMNVELDKHLTLTEKAFNLVSETTAAIPDRPITEATQSFKVAVPLLNKVSNDLRTASLLALWGYPTQALSLVSSLYESAFTIAHIGADNELAQRWIDHEDPTKAFGNMIDLTRSGLRKLGTPDADQQATVEYRVYSQLSMAKHTNPVYAQQHAYKRVDSRITSYNGPDISEPAIRAGWFALEHAAALTCIALHSFILNRVPSEARRGLISKLLEIGHMRKELEGRARERWGTEDPFPGGWRELT